MSKKIFVDLPLKEREDYLVDYHESAVMVRGNVLNIVTALEMSIDLYITAYFVSDADKSEELMNLIISPRLSFENKLQVLLVLLERHNPTLLSSYPTMNKDIIHIIEQRNVLAHYPLDTTAWGMQRYVDDGSLTFFKFKNVRENDEKGKKKEIKLTNSIIYDVSKTEDLINLADKYNTIIALNISTAPPPDS